MSHERPASTVGPSAAPAVDPMRLVDLERAVELQVDRDDFVFESDEERRLWDDLEDEFHCLVTKIGPVWIAG